MNIKKILTFENSFSDVNEIQEFMNTFFPSWTWSAKLRAFDCGPDQLAHEVRLDYFAEFAKKEELCPKQAST